MAVPRYNGGNYLPEAVIVQFYNLSSDVRPFLSDILRNAEIYVVASE